MAFKIKILDAVGENVIEAVVSNYQKVFTHHPDLYQDEWDNVFDLMQKVSDNHKDWYIEFKSFYHNQS